VTKTRRATAPVKPVAGYENSYVVSSDGKVWSVDRYDRRGRFWAGQPLKQTINSVGYPVVTLWKDNQGKTIGVHILVLTMFEGPCPDGLEALHEDDVKTHNDIGNLSWGTRGQNLRDAYRNGNMPRYRPRKVLA
jgi:hypothetical protein